MQWQTLNHGKTVGIQVSFLCPLWLILYRSYYLFQSTNAAGTNIWAIPQYQVLLRKGSQPIRATRRSKRCSSGQWPLGTLEWNHARWLRSWCEIPVPRKFMHLMSSGRSSDCLQHSRVPLRAWLLISRRSHKPAPFVRRGWGLDAIDVSTARAFTPTMSQNPTAPVQ